MLKIRNFLGITSLIFIGLFCATLFLPHSPYIRYQNFTGTIYSDMKWIYERIHYDDTPVELAIIGSSRANAGIDPAALSKALNVNSANFSIPATGNDIRWTLARELLETRDDVKVLILPVLEQFPRDSHQIFGDAARADEVFFGPWLINRSLPVNIARMPVRQIDLAIKSTVPSAYGFSHEFDHANYRGPTPDRRDPNLEIADSPDELAAGSKQRYWQIRSRILPASLSEVEFGMSYGSFKRILKLAEAKGTKVVFLYIPFYRGYETPVEAEWLKANGTYIDASFMREDTAAYADSGHMTRAGGQKLTAWLATELKNTGLLEN